jgi:hemerythrin superfamily protein
MTTTKANADQDVVDLLLTQHRQVKQLFSQLRTSSGSEKQELFNELTRILAVHESAEEQVVHPAARMSAGDGEVQARLEEEDAAKHVLAELYDMGIDDPQFDSKLAMFADAVIAHSEHEEDEEFPALRSRHDAATLRKMAGAVRAAEAIAPTRPHPSGGESATANIIAGPPLAMFDRVRDAVRDWSTKNNAT